MGKLEDETERYKDDLTPFEMLKTPYDVCYPFRRLLVTPYTLFSPRKYKRPLTKGLKTLQQTRNKESVFKNVKSVQRAKAEAELAVEGKVPENIQDSLKGMSPTISVRP